MKNNAYQNFTVLGARAAIFAGGCTAAFWLTTIPFESFAGSEVSIHPIFIPGQILHLLAAAFTALGVIGIFLAIRLEGNVANSAFLLCFLGALAFFADGAIALVTFPPIAHKAPELISSNGLMFTGWVLGFFVGFSVLQMFGYLAFGVICWISEKMPRDGCVLLMLGGVVTNLPPMPGLHWLLILGGLVWSAGFIRLGLSALTHARSS